MEKQMSKRLRLGIIAAILVVVAIVATFWALILIQQHSAALRKARYAARFCSR